MTTNFSVKPRIDRTNLKPICVRAGKIIKYDVDVRGEPPPTITWFQNKNEVKSEGNIEIINIDYNTKITISNSIRKNTGIYKIKAVNEHGSDEAEVEITVLCEYSLGLVLGLLILLHSISVQAERTTGCY